MPDTPSETNVPIADWTTGTLKIYHDAVIGYERQVSNERDLRYQERFEGQERNIQTATEAIDKRLDILNELRSGVATNDQVEALEKIVAAQGKLIYIGLGIVMTVEFAIGVLLVVTR